MVKKNARKTSPIMAVMHIKGGRKMKITITGTTLSDHKILVKDLQECGNEYSFDVISLIYDMSNHISELVINSRPRLSDRTVGRLAVQRKMKKAFGHPVKVRVTAA